MNPFVPETDKLEQHFLADRSVVDRLIEAAHIESTDTVLEIGAGTGVITTELARRANRVIAIECDSRFIPALLLIQGEHKNISIYQQRIQDVDLPPFDCIVANPPFNTIEPTLNRLLGNPFKCAVLLVGGRLVKAASAPAGTEYFTKSTIMLQSYFKFEVIEHVPRKSLFPLPRTNPAIVKLVPRNLWELVDAPVLFIFREILGSGRQLLKNALRDAMIRWFMTQNQSLTRNEARHEIQRLHVPARALNKRVDGLSNEDLAVTYIAIEQHIKKPRHKC